MPLTKKMRLYVEARLSGKNQTGSAIYAGCPEATAAQAASRYEKHPEVVAHLNRMRGGIVKESPQLEREGKEMFSKSAAQPTPIAIAQAEQGAEHDPLKYFRDVMNDTKEDPRIRLDAAKALASFTIAKPVEKGKKEVQQDAAEKVASRFQSSAPPKLAAVGGRKV